ncbi:MAG TPA: alpha/beta hydrolase [Cellulomonadaceae bacterium]|nr:alpha/beta hydrolase [Cellulomonadaceae bacterium]
MSTVTSRDGTTIVYDVAGDGSPVILVGGALSDRRSAAALAQVLARDLRAVTYDRRGRGGSGDTPPYAVDREIEDLAALVDEVGGHAFVYGHSSGAALVLAAAAAGVPVERLVVFEPPYVVGARRVEPTALAEELRALLSAGRRGEVVERFMTDAVGLPPQVVAQTRQSPAWPSLEALAHTILYDLQIMGDDRPPEAALAHITVPTLVLGSSASPGWLHDAVVATAASIPGAEHRLLPGSFHGVPPQDLAPVLVAFFLS